MQKVFLKLSNPIVKWLLKSPLHGIMSGHYLLISVTGRKSGKVYTTPVEYGRDGSTIRVITSQQHTWWKNVKDGGQVGLRIQGREYTGQATVAMDEQTVTAAFHTIYPKFSEERVHQLSPGCVIVQIRLA